MATFEVKVTRVAKIEEHPNADRLTVVHIDGFRCIANKKDDGSWRYKDGDLVVYIPEGAVVPESVLRKLNMWNDEKGMGILSGKQGNRVKAIRLRGIVSQGLLYPVRGDNDDASLGLNYLELEDDTVLVNEGDDVAELMGIVKYEPPIPSHMAGEVACLHEYAFHYDVENWQKYPEILQENEEVIFTEKIHGTFMGIGWIPGLDHPDLPGAKPKTFDEFDSFTKAEFPELDGRVLLFSKGLGAKGLFFKDNENNAGNMYLQMFKKLNDEKKLLVSLKSLSMMHDGEPVFVLGELYGDGVQDLKYGMSDGNKHFRLFDIYVGKPGSGEYQNYDLKVKMAKIMGIDTVVELYRGPWSKDVADQYCAGKDILSESHVREGVVVNTAVERRDDSLGRVQLKYINPDYLLRKGNTTEYQ